MTGITKLADRRFRKLYIGVVTACGIGILTFYSLPDAIAFLVRLAMMVAAQIAAGKELLREHPNGE